MAALMTSLTAKMMTGLSAIVFMLVAVGVLMVATLIWCAVLVGLLAAAGLRLPLASRQARMMRMARLATGERRP